ncbi:TetR/AcrR family transcriptional regulator [Streptomyces sp. NBC_00536]|uniref:TetR/AcrR family transcriptional regulator n=1 Tax=Streptomyces sp. NBC_00536 TaxID=2975769 RepID=UPI002E807FF7|nr:TetR/AcrR family transcriptional regulator [Streptomyces sp. NBC_00536]WUC81775.1 TetR/AcrR family transcriptional regulator [Streptomyces sp. NBC_00536]
MAPSQTASTDSDRPPRRRVHTRARLLDAAGRVLVERGYAKTTIEDVCAAAGYTRGAFYSSFESKQDLVLALFDRHSAHRLDQLESLLHAPAPGSARRIGELLLAVDPDERGWILLFLEFRLDAARSPELSARLHEHDKAVTGALALLLERNGKSAGAQSLATFLLASREGVLARTATGGPGSDEVLDAAVDVLAELLPALLPSLNHAP